MKMARSAAVLDEWWDNHGGMPVGRTVRSGSRSGQAGAHGHGEKPPALELEEADRFPTPSC